MEQAREFVNKFINIIKKPEMRILPGQLAFFLVMSLIPLAALLGAIASTFNIPTSTLEDLMLGTIPKGVADFIIEIMNTKRLNFNMVVFFISAFILASNGPHSMIITSNEIYKIKSRNYAIRRLKAILMTFVMAGLFLVLFLIPVFGDYIFELLRNNISEQNTINILYLIYQIIKYPLLVIVLHFNIKLLYMIAPDKQIKAMTTTKGALFTTIGWILATEVYSVYIGAFSNYDKFYGSISNVIILMVWIYILAYIFDIGMIINAGAYKTIIENTKVVEDE